VQGSKRAVVCESERARDAGRKMMMMMRGGVTFRILTHSAELLLLARLRSGSLSLSLTLLFRLRLLLLLLETI
jgi:hypothetical protein